MVGDRFFSDTFNELHIMMNESLENRHLPRTYIQEYYNVRDFAKTGELGNSISRIRNVVIEAINDNDRLPCFLLVFIDKDIIRDTNVFASDAVKCVRDVTDWITRQINILIRCKRLELIEHKPGAIYCKDPVIIYVKML